MKLTIFSVLAFTVLVTGIKPAYATFQCFASCETFTPAHVEDYGPGTIYGRKTVKTKAVTFMRGGYFQMPNSVKNLTDAAPYVENFCRGFKNYDGNSSLECDFPEVVEQPKPKSKPKSVPTVKKSVNQNSSKELNQLKKKTSDQQLVIDEQNKMLADFKARLEELEKDKGIKSNINNGSRGNDKETESPQGDVKVSPSAKAL